MDPYPTFPTPTELMVHLNVGQPPERTEATRVVTERTGDGISSHEKKRHYLECIEQYIQFLHEQMVLLGERVPEIERVASYRGLSSRSIRTLLVHMEQETGKLRERTRGEEARFCNALG